MIDQRPATTHAQQVQESHIAALVEAGIGKAYAARSLADLGEQGEALKRWMIENRERVMGGYGFDFRGTGAASSDMVMLAARALLHFGLSVKLIPLVRLPKMLGSDDETALLRTVRHLVIRDFETSHENPLRPYETALVESLIEERLGDGLAVSVLRRRPVDSPAGWWSATVEDMIEQNAKVVAV